MEFGLKVEQVDVPGPELFWMSDRDKWYTLFFNVVLIQEDDVTALINTGAPEDLTTNNEL